MKNIHILPTDKPSRLFIGRYRKELFLCDKPTSNIFITGQNQNIYITSDEEIKEGDYVGYPTLKNWVPVKYLGGDLTGGEKKIILTTDQDLIADGVQAIDDEFLEWFVKNPSCEEVHVYNQTQVGYEYDEYHFILPDYNTKQETPEEAAENYVRNESDVTLKLISKYSFKDGAKWQAERSQSIVPFDAYNIEVFAIKPDEQGKLFAYIGYKISNGNFHFSIVPFTEPKGT